MGQRGLRLTNTTEKLRRRSLRPRGLPLLGLAYGGPNGVGRETLRINEAVDTLPHEFYTPVSF